MNPTNGDVFLIPIQDGRYAPAQVIAFETRTLYCISSGIFNQPILDHAGGASLILDETKLFSTVLVFHSEFRSKKWQIVQNQELEIKKKNFPYEKNIKGSGIGVMILEAAMLTLVVNAFYRLTPGISTLSLIIAIRCY